MCIRDRYIRLLCANKNFLLAYLVQDFVTIRSHLLKMSPEKKENFDLKVVLMSVSLVTIAGNKTAPAVLAQSVVYYYLLCVIVN